MLPKMGYNAAGKAASNNNGANHENGVLTPEETWVIL